MNLHTARFRQPEVLKITGLRPATLQTWINQKSFVISDQNPGRGRSRLYSGMDICRLIVTRYVSEMRMDLCVARELSGIAEREISGSAINMNMQIIIHFNDGKLIYKTVIDRYENAFRDALTYAESFALFPLGEIVNGALLKIKAA